MSSTNRRCHVECLTACGLIAFAIILAGGCASVPSVPPAARAEFTPTSKLRVGLILSNQVLVAKDPSTGELRGVTVTLGKALAQRLRVPFEAVGYTQKGGQERWSSLLLAFKMAKD